ncbi:MAG: Asp-tRNA(Asn)/Glu-tRNA(Gln) amidotransferase subunit GatC [Sulfobacillus sp.]
MFPEAEVRAIAALARLDLDDQEVARLGAELGQILNYISSIMAALPADAQTWQAAPNGRQLEADQVAASLPWDRAVGAAPAHDAAGFVVPFPGEAT